MACCDYESVKILKNVGICVVELELRVESGLIISLLNNEHVIISR